MRLRDRFDVEDDQALGPTLYVDVGRRRLGLCLCHRRKDRSLPLLGLERWLCARCVGILLGGVAAAVLLVAGASLPWTAALALSAPLAVDWGTQFAGWRESTNGLRLATGLLSGLSLVGWWGL